MKKFLVLVLALVMALSLVACSKPADDAGDTAADGKTVVKAIVAQYGDQTAQWWKDFEAKFEADNGDIDLIVDCVSWNDISTVVTTRIANNDAPDLLNIDVFAAYQADDLLLPAQEWVSEETYAKFFPGFLEQSVVDGTVWAVPDLASARALYYNADILAEAGVEVPTTWDELIAACKTIKEKLPEIYPWGVDMTTDEGQACFAYYAWNNGGGFVDADGNWALNSEKNVEAVEFITGMVADGLTNTDPTNDTRYKLQELFANGQLAMMIGPNQISKYCENNGGINYGIASIPTNGDAAGASVGVMDRIMCFAKEGRTEAELAAITKVVDVFYDDQPYADWVLMEDFLPATSTGNELCAAANPSMAAWTDVIDSALFYPTAKAEWDDVKQGVIKVQQEVLLGGDAKTLLDALQAEIAG